MSVPVRDETGWALLVGWIDKSSELIKTSVRKHTEKNPSSKVVKSHLSLAVKMILSPAFVGMMVLGAAPPM